MKRLVLTILAVGAAALAACSPKETATETATAPAAAPPADTGGTAGAAAKTTARGSGTVSAIDPAAGTITLDHGPIPELDWPGMTMAFKASADIAEQVRVGDKVDFDVKVGDGAPEITAARKP